MRLISLILLSAVLNAPALRGELVELTRISDPWERVTEGPATVTASGGGQFLINGKRVTASGVVLDAMPLAGPSDNAFTWHEGWLTAATQNQHHQMKRVHENGTVEHFRTIPQNGIKVASASNGTRYAFIERRGETFRITSVSETTLSVADVEPADRTVLRPSGDGFILLNWHEQSDGVGTLRIHRLAPDGTTLQSRDAGEVAIPLSIAAVSDGTRVAIFECLRNGQSARVVQADLNISPPIPYESAIFCGGPSLALPLPNGFFLSHGYSGGATANSRALVINQAGQFVSNDPEEPVATGARAGNTYLVTRLSGDGVITHGHPLAAPSAQLAADLTTWTGRTVLSATSSSGVTLVLLSPAFGSPSAFQRMTASGTLVDPAPQEIHDIPTYPGPAVVPIPDGFAFIWNDGTGTVRFRRLSRTSSWIDDQPAAVFSGLESWVTPAAHANANDIVVAWPSGSNLKWERISFSGQRLQSTPWEASSGAPDIWEPEGTILIAGRGNARLLTLRQVQSCPVLCPITPGRYTSIAIAPDGAPIAPPTFQLVSSTAEGHAVGLPDGTWALALSRGEGFIHHLAADGSLLSSTRTLMLDRMIWSAEPTTTGWAALLESPAALVEFTGPSTPTAVSGLGELTNAQFAVGDVIYTREDFRRAPIVSAGRLASAPGDLSLTAGPVVRAHGTYLTDITVRNNGSSTVNAITLGNSGYLQFVDNGSTRSITLDALAPGATRTVRVNLFNYRSVKASVHVVSEQLRDIAPSDNSLLLTTPATPPQGRTHGTR